MLNEPQLALRRIRQFQHLLKEVRPHQSMLFRQQRKAEIMQLLPLIRKIAQRVDASLLPRLADLDSSWSDQDIKQSLETMDLVIGQIIYADDALQILGPSGPILAASGLHDWVWGAAKGRWDDGYYGDAVHEAAEVVNHKTQVRMERKDLNGVELYQVAFSPNEPTTADSRLRLANIDPTDTETWKSAHLGAMKLGEACSQGIRNLLAHKKADLSEQQALEQLGALSVLARWVDSSKLVKADEA